MKRRRNPSVPTPLLIVGGLAGAAALVYWATRSTAAATAQQLVQSGAQALLPAAQGALAYTGDVQGRVLTPAEAAAMGLIPAVGSLSESRSATLTAAMAQVNDPTLSPETRASAARLVAQLQESVS